MKKQLLDQLKKNWGWILVLTLWIGIQGIYLSNWITTDTMPLGWDEAIHTNVAYDYKDRIHESGFWAHLKPAYFNYPPLYHLMLIPFLNIPADVADAGALLNFFYLILLILAVFFIGTHLFGKGPALAAALMVSSYPIIIAMARIPMIDVALTAWVAVSFLCLLKSDHFHHVGWSIAFGVTAALGSLTKWPMAVQLFCPVVYSLFFAFRRKNFKGLLWASGVYLVLILPWYGSNLIPVAVRVAKSTAARPASDLIFGKVLHWFWYGLAFFQQINVVYLLLLIPGVVVGIKEKKLRPVLIWFAGSLLLFTLIHNRNLRYTMPALPAAALLSVAWFSPKKKWIWGGLCVVALFFLTLFYSQTRSLGNFKLGPVPVVLFPGNPPRAQDWKHEAILDRVLALKNPNSSFTRIIAVSNLAPFHSKSFNITVRKRGLDGVSFRGPSKRRWTEMAEFILTKTGPLGPKATIGRIEKYAQVIQNPPDWFSAVFKEVGRWPLPDGSEAILLQSNPTPSELGDVGLFNLELDEMTFGRIKAQGVRLRATPLSKEDTTKGRLKEFYFECKTINYKNLVFNGVKIHLTNPQINLPLFLETQQIEFLQLGRLKPDGQIEAASLYPYAERKLKWLKNPRVHFKGSQIHVQGKAYGIPVEVYATLQVTSGQLETSLDKLRIAKIPFPLLFLRGYTNRTIPLEPNREMPFFFDIKTIEGEEETLRIAA